MTRGIYIALSDHLKKLSKKGEDKVFDFKLPDTHLSPVRDQGEFGLCSYIATIACIEVIYRKLGLQLSQEWNGLYYFNFNECVDHLYKQLSHLEKAEKLAMDTSKGARVDDVLLYVIRRGLLATTVCEDGRDMNHVAHFDNKAPRYHISCFRTLEHDEVLTCLEEYPVIAYISIHDSFLNWKKPIYYGALQNEDRNTWYTHAVLVVGSLNIERDGRKQPFLIIQNSYGIKHGFKGYVILPFEEKFFKCFWLPIINPQMMDLPYGKVEKVPTIPRKRKLTAGALGYLNCPDVCSEDEDDEDDSEDEKY
ncbi:uncharacterized protein [Primulina eburnea]|uniref:uncharacterized protein n=1 Tax=Primulina eburnea TaxID=1245227 RepID=UPI003C6C023E